MAMVAGRGSGGSATQGQNGFTPAPQTGGTLTEWVGSTRTAAAQLYQKQHPKTTLDIVSNDGEAEGPNCRQTKVGLFDRTGNGRPDVVFSSQNNEVTSARQANFPAPLKRDLIQKSTLNGRVSGAVDPCTMDGTVYCLRNDRPQTVLSYNATPMKQWSDRVPTTLPEYRALGQKVATERAGYLVGATGGTFTPKTYLGTSRCGANQIADGKNVSANTTSANSARSPTERRSRRPAHSPNTSSAPHRTVCDDASWIGGRYDHGHTEPPGEVRLDKCRRTVAAHIRLRRCTTIRLTLPSCRPPSTRNSSVGSTMRPVEYLDRTASGQPSSPPCPHSAQDLQVPGQRPCLAQTECLSYLEGQCCLRSDLIWSTGFRYSASSWR